VLREHASSVGEDVELTAPARCHLRVDPERLTELGRETRGPFVVAASGGAEEDLDGHVSNPSRRRQIVLNCSNGWRQSEQ
jgi:hypothetical protein